MIFDKLLHNKSSVCIGVDITPSAIRVLELGFFRGQYLVHGFSEVLVEDEMVVNGKFLRPDTLGALIAEATDKVNKSIDQVAVAVPGSLVVTKVIPLSKKLTRFEKEEQVWIEVSSNFPYAPKDLKLDFFDLGPTQANPEKVDILLVAAHAEDVQARLDLLNFAGLTPKIIEVDHFALVHACKLVVEHEESSDHRTIAFVDVTETSVKLVVMHDYFVVYTREINFAEIEEKSKNLTNTLSSGEVSEEEGLPPIDEDKSLQGVLSLHINRAIQFFYSTSDHGEIDLMLLGGQASILEDLSDSVKKITGIHTVVANPFLHMKSKRKVDMTSLQRMAPQFMTACGLALRGIRL